MYQVNFSLWRAERRFTRYRFWRNAGVCQCALWLLALLIVQGQSRVVQVDQQANLAALTQQQMVLSEQYQAVQHGMTQLQQIEQRAQVYRQAQQSAYRYTTLLQLLSQHIPSSCWLVNLLPQGDGFVFEAISQDYAAIDVFLVQLSRQSLLANVRLQKIVQQDNGTFRFAVWAGWQEGEDSHE